MKNIIAILGVLAVVVLTSGCTTLSREECVSMDWHNKGLVDGGKGRAEEDFLKYQDQCSRQGVQVVDSKRAQYGRGREVGLKRFCTYEGGLELGQQGESYRDVCPQGSATLFKKGYEIGIREHLVKEAEERLQKEQAEVAQNVANSMSTCRSDWDCAKSDQCVFDKCSSNGMACTFNSDCPSTQGNCDATTQWINGTSVEVRACRF